MKTYDTVYSDNGRQERETFSSLTAAKKWMRSRPGSKGYITKVYANGDFEPCGEITLNGRNAVQMSNQTTATY